MNNAVKAFKGGIKKWIRRRSTTKAIFGLVILIFLGVEIKLMLVSHGSLEHDDREAAVKKGLGLHREDNNHGKVDGKKSFSSRSRRVENIAPTTSSKTAVKLKAEKQPDATATGIPSINGVPSYRDDLLCGGCRSLKMESLSRGIHKERCGIIIYQVAKEHSGGISILEAARKVVYEMNHTDCLPCIECSENHKQYWRYDHAAPQISTAKTYYFSSIPEQEHRIPESALKSDNLTDYFATLNQQGLPPKQYLFEYNPSIIPLPDNVLLDGLKERPVYLASFRIATTQGCFPIDTTLQLIGGDWVSDRIPEKKDYLGLLLLRSDLSVIEEVIVDVPRRFRKREDFRLFLLYNQIYVGSYCKMTPLFITHKDDSQKNSLPVNDQATRHLADARNVFPSPLKIKMAIDYSECAKERFDNKHAKNLNYFINSHNQSIAEMFPLNPHVVREVHITDASLPIPGQEDDIKDDTMPSPSFYNLDELILANESDFFEQPFTDDRGGACCITIPDPRKAAKSSLWLGISHVKTPHGRRKLQGKVQSNQYLSRWYAFEPQEPYPIVAVSGYFCLSSHPGKASSTSKDQNPLLPYAVSKANLTLGSYEFDCPVIHFVTGMTEKADDPSKLIVAYGVADCISWFVEISKSEVVKLLFSPPDHHGDIKLS